MDLSTTYLGIRLPNPFVAGASPLCDSIDRARELVNAGCSMLTLRSLFEEQLDKEALAHHAAAAAHADSHGEATSYLPEPHGCVFGPDEYLAHLRALKAAVEVPVAASLNGHSRGGWLDYARRIADAGADALEINLYDVVSDPDRDAASVEQEMVDVVGAVAAAIAIPVAVKLSPFYTSLPNLGRRLLQAGAKGLVLFNRFFEPDLDCEALEVETHMMFSTSRELLLRLRWLALLSGKLGCDLAVSGGVHTPRDAVKAVMCGASAVQVVATLVQGGAGQVRDLIDGLAAWLTDNGYESLAQMRGSMDAAHAPDPHAYERVNYVHLLQTWRFA
ncbi:MAG: dihydroorotate dehydrogenase-like protein [Planctomycetes bacterium]|nr:dihydroorotate dehydrogenase-like protein [Planctomycetota bacterium]